MNQFTKFQRTEHRLLSERINALLKPLEAEFGVSLQAGGGVVGDFEGVVKVAVKIKKTATGADPQQIEFARYAALFGMKPTDYNRAFWMEGTMYRVTGFNLNAPKFPINGVREHDKRSFRFTSHHVLAEFAKQDAKAGAAA